MAKIDAFLAAQSDEDRIFLRRALDKAALAEKTGRVTATKFLTPAQAALTGQFCQQAAIRVIFDGGYADAERVLALFPPAFYEDVPDAVLLDESPLAILHITPHGDEPLTHRDYLGALLAAGITREAIGDIEVTPDGAYLFCLGELVPFLCQSVERIGRAVVDVCEVARTRLPPKAAPRGETFFATVSALRLDAVIAAGYHLSREEAQKAIAQELCSVDHLPASKPDGQVSENALLSLRGKGRLRLLEVRGETRKGRLALSFFRYL